MKNMARLASLAFLLAFWTVAIPAYSQDTQANSITQIQVELRDLNNFEGTIIPPPPGAITPIPGLPHSSPDLAGRLVIVDNPSLNGASMDDIRALASNISEDAETYTIARVEENDDPVIWLPGPPADKRLLGIYRIRGKVDRYLDLVVATAIAAGKEETFGRYATVEVAERMRPSSAGFNIGGGGATTFNMSDGTFSFGGGIGKSWGEVGAVPLVVVKMYDGAKGPAQQTGEAQMDYPDGLEPIYFAFDVDRPLPGQEDKMRRWAEWLGANLGHLRNRGKTVMFVGWCDSRGSENYNSALGFRRAKNVMYPVGGLLVESGTGASRADIAGAITPIFRAVSASNHMPHFSNGNSEQMHQANRRVDLVIVDRNLTLANVTR